MRRFWLVFLLPVLMIAISTSAYAVDLKVSGEYFAGGMYLDKTSLKKDTATDGPSTAFYFQRLRLRADFIVSPGLTLTTRANIMSRAWGATRSTPASTADNTSAATRAENENIGFDHLYVTYVSPIGTFRAGYMDDYVWGPSFVNSASPNGRISYSYVTGPFIFLLGYSKVLEKSNSAVNPSAASAGDNDTYSAAIIYNWKNGAAGFLIKQYAYFDNKAANNFKRSFTLLSPYTMVKFGPVAVQAELLYAFGKFAEYESGKGDDIKLENLAIMIDAVADFGKVYAGGTFAYVSGDDPGTTDKQEGNVLFGGSDFNPCLIMWNWELGYWAGSPAGHDNAVQANGGAGKTSNQGMSNTWFFQGRAGVKPVAKLDIMASVSYANADKKPSAAWINNSYGWEADLIATYKITNNLTYMLGAGYLFTGDYYKGTSEANKVSNEYLVLNKLVLTF